MSQAIRATVGLVVLSSTIVSFAYLISKGSSNEKNIVETTLVASLKDEINDKDSMIEFLEGQNAKLKTDQTRLESTYKQASDYINSKNNFDLPSIYKQCLNSRTTIKPTEVIDRDYEKYSSVLLDKTPKIKSYIEEVIPAYTKRYIQVTELTTKTVSFIVNEISVLNIYPECTTSVTPYAKFTYDIVKGTIASVN